MVNKVILIGRLGKDPEVKYLEGGNSVAKLTIATSETYRDKEGNRQEKTEWHNCNAWGKLAEIAEKYLKKGSMVYAEGSLQTRSWEDKDGNKKYATDVRLETFRMLDSKRDGGSVDSSRATSGSESTGAAEPIADDLPF